MLMRAHVDVTPLYEESPVRRQLCSAGEIRQFCDQNWLALLFVFGKSTRWAAKHSGFSLRNGYGPGMCVYCSLTGVALLYLGRAVELQRGVPDADRNSNHPEHREPAFPGHTWLLIHCKAGRVGPVQITFY